MDDLVPMIGKTSKPKDATNARAGMTRLTGGDGGDATFSTPAAAAPIAGFLGLVDTDIETDIDLPATLSVSAYHQLTNKWAILADVTWTEWSVMDELRIEFDSGAADSVITLD
jgi:long-chain fatty acid transport protein